MPGPANDLNISQTGFQSFDGTSQFFGRTITGGTGITVTNGNGVSGNPIITANGANDLHTARFIVSVNGTSGTGANYSTIASAITAAQGVGGNQTIFIMPGTYNENLTLIAGICLTAFDSDPFVPNVKINGNITFSSAGNCSITGIFLSSTSGSVLTISGSSACSMRLFNCSLSAAGGDILTNSNSNSSSNFQVNQCLFDAAGAHKIFNMTGSGYIQFYGCIGSNSSLTTTSSTISSGTVFIYFTQFETPITSSSAATLDIRFSFFECSAINSTALTIGGSGTNNLSHTEIRSGTASGISVSQSVSLQCSTVRSSNTNAITGAGTLTYGTIDFTGTSSLINTTTQSPLVASNTALRVVSASGASYTTVPQDAVILVDGNVTATIVPLASPATGQRHRIKDNAGTAATHNITVTPSGKNIDGAASYVINLNYGSIDICYNGTQWNVL